MKIQLVEYTWSSICSNPLDVARNRDLFGSRGVFLGIRASLEYAVL